jgi:hypothetical protein
MPPCGTYDQIFLFWQLRVSWCRAPSLTRGWVYNLLAQLLLGLDIVVTLGPKHRRTQEILQSPLRLHEPGGPSPRIHIPGNRVAQLYPRTLGSFFVASCDSQGYGGGIVTRLHTVIWVTSFGIQEKVLLQRVYKVKKEELARERTQKEVKVNFW